MLFWIILIVLVCLSIAAGFIGYHAVGYNQPDNSAISVFLTVIVGGLLAFGILMSTGEAASSDPKNYVTKSEHTYTVTDGSVPTVKSGKLEFSYTEDGKIFPYSEYVDSFEVGMEKPKAFKITHYDIVDQSVVPWVMDDNTAVEIIK